MSKQVSLEGVGPSPLVEKVVHGFVFALLLVSIVGIAFIFGLNPSQDFTWDNVSAVVRALGVDGTFYLGIFLARRLWNQGGWGKGFFWFSIASIAALISWFANSLFVTQQHLVTQDLLNGAGFSWANAQLVNQIVGAIPITIILIYSFVPRQQALDQRTPEQILQDSARRIALLQARNAERAALAGEAGAGLRSTVGGFFKQVIPQQEALPARQRKALAEDAGNIHRQMRALADFAMLSSCEDDEGDLDYQMLEQRLKDAGLWPPVHDAAQEDVQPDEEESYSDLCMSAVTSSGMPKWFTEEQVGQLLGISVSQAHERMKADYRGRYKRINSREFVVNRKKVRKAHHSTLEKLLNVDSLQWPVQSDTQASA